MRKYTFPQFLAAVLLLALLLGFYLPEIKPSASKRTRTDFRGQTVVKVIANPHGDSPHARTVVLARP